jgi:hypothetical protein
VDSALVFTVCCLPVPLPVCLLLYKWMVNANCVSSTWTYKTINGIISNPSEQAYTDFYNELFAIFHILLTLIFIRYEKEHSITSRNAVFQN